MELIMVLMVPVTAYVVKIITGKLKTMGTIPTADNRVAIIRGLVAILSLVGAVLTQYIGGSAIDSATLETLVLTVMNGLLATGMYLWSNKG